MGRGVGDTPMVWIWAVAGVLLVVGEGRTQTMPQTPSPSSPQAPATQSPPVTPGQPAVAPPSPPAVEAVSPPPQAAPAAPLARGNPGLIEEIGKLLDGSGAKWPPPLSLPAIKTPSEVWEDLKAGAGQAGGNLPQIGRPMVVTGRVVCPVVANAGPDCVSAANQLCREKGFSEGKSTDIETARNCSVKAMLSGRTDEPGACRRESYVTRAACQ